MDRTKQGARRALLDAFAELATSRRYQDFGVGLIAQRAKVARSTFYYHFKAKDDLLLQNLAPMFAALARLPGSEEPGEEAHFWVAHLWDHRVRARRILNGAAQRRIGEALALQVRARLGELTESPVAPERTFLVAEQIVGSMLGLLRAWIDGKSAATPGEITPMLWSGARGLVSTAR